MAEMRQRADHPANVIFFLGHKRAETRVAQD